MGRVDVRAAVTAWFAPPNVAGLNTVYSSPPKFTAGRLAFDGVVPGVIPSGDSPSSLSGAVGFVYLLNDGESRIAFGGPHGGEKYLGVDTYLTMFWMSFQRVAQDAEDDHDLLVDNVRKRLRADRNLGQDSTVIFEAGERGGIRVRSGLPETNKNGALVRWTTVQWTTYQALTQT